MQHSLKMGIRKQIKTEYGLQDLVIEFEVKPGELLAIIGPQGSGKSFALRTLAGTARPDEGFLEVDGKIWFDSVAGICLPPQQRSSVFLQHDQDLTLPRNTTVEDSLFASLRLSDRNNVEWVQQILELTSLTAVKRSRLCTLPAKCRAKVSIAQALASRPQLLLIDQPFCELDWDLRTRLLDELKKLHERVGLTTILATRHYLDVSRVADSSLQLKGLEDVMEKSNSTNMPLLAY